MKLRWRIQEQTLAVTSATSAVLLTCLTVVAIMSPGKHGPFLVGLTAPVLSLTHFSTLLGVGAWAARLGQPEVWAMPGSFLAGMIPGIVFGVAQAPLPALDLPIKGLLLVSLVPLAAAILLLSRLATRDAVTTMMVFGGLHGHLLGVEAASNSASWVDLGAVTSAAMVLMMGIGLGSAQPESRQD
jgi:hydrogenase/urease accessory protein HupE